MVCWGISSRHDPIPYCQPNEKTRPRAKVQASIKVEMYVPKLASRISRIKYYSRLYDQ